MPVRHSMSQALGALIVSSALCACAASSASTEAGMASRPATQTVGGTDVGRLTISNTTSPDVVKLSLAPDAVWRTLPAIFDSLTIPVSTLDPARKTIGNDGFKIRQRLGKAPLSRYLDCGNTQIGPNADSYDVMLSVVTTVTPNEASGATISTIVDARARPITFNQGYSQCSSKGGIELRITDLLKRLLAG